MHWFSHEIYHSHNHELKVKKISFFFQRWPNKVWRTWPPQVRERSWISEHEKVRWRRRWKPKGCGLVEVGSKQGSGGKGCRNPPTRASSTGRNSAFFWSWIRTDESKRNSQINISRYTQIANSFWLKKFFQYIIIKIRNCKTKKILNCTKLLFSTGFCSYCSWSIFSIIYGKSHVSCWSSVIRAQLPDDSIRTGLRDPELGRRTKKRGRGSVCDFNPRERREGELLSGGDDGGSKLSWCSKIPSTCSR